MASTRQIRPRVHILNWCQVEKETPVTLYTGDSQWLDVDHLSGKANQAAEDLAQELE